MGLFKYKPIYFNWLLHHTGKIYIRLIKNTLKSHI
jgi:hypothetical protein